MCAAQNHTVECEGFHALRELFWESSGGISVELGSMDGFFASEGLVLERAAGFKRILIEADPTWRAARRKFSSNAVGVTAAICATGSSQVSAITSHHITPPVPVTPHAHSHATQVHFRAGRRT